MTVAAESCGSRCKLEDDRGLGRLLAGAEERVLGHRDVHARAGDLGDGGNGARDFAFERAAVVHVLEELGLAERGAIEDLEADAARAGQPLGRDVEPQPIDLRRSARGCRGRRRPACSRPSARPASRRPRRRPSGPCPRTAARSRARDPPRRADDQADDGDERQDERDLLLDAQLPAKFLEPREELIEIHTEILFLQ